MMFSSPPWSYAMVMKSGRRVIEKVTLCVETPKTMGLRNWKSHSERHTFFKIFVPYASSSRCKAATSSAKARSCAISSPTRDTAYMTVV